MTPATDSRARTPLPACLVLDCDAWRKAAGCGHLAARTLCLARRRMQTELPTVKMQVDGGEQLRMMEVKE